MPLVILLLESVVFPKTLLTEWCKTSGSQWDHVSGCKLVNSKNFVTATQNYSTWHHVVISSTLEVSQVEDAPLMMYFQLESSSSIILFEEG